MNLTQPTWVFGYGSLIWKQDFPYLDSRLCWIDGWVRRFWQGSHDHRGYEHDPGRVVTLIESPGEKCHGRAFLVEYEVFEHLDHREKNGYERVEVAMFSQSAAFDGVVYRAAEGNEAFLGPAPISEIAAQINRCVGPSGTNRDYLLELADVLRQLNYSDQHVFEIEKIVRSSILREADMRVIVS